MTTNNKLGDIFNFESLSTNTSPEPTTNVFSKRNPDTITTVATLYFINDESPITPGKAEKIAWNARVGRERAAAAVTAYKKLVQQQEEEVDETEEEFKLAELHRLNGTIKPTAMDDTYAEFVYRMKYWYLLCHDPEPYAEMLKEKYKLFRGFEPYWKVLEFDPTINYWMVFKDKHDHSYKVNLPSYCIRWRKNIYSALGSIPNRYAMLFNDDFDFENVYP